MSVTKRMRILKTVEIGEKNAKRIHILKTVELADFAEKNPKRMGILKVREFECSAPLSELKPLQCTVLFLCKMQIPIEKNLILFSNVLRTFSFTKQGSLRAISRKSTSFRSRRFPRPRKFTVFTRAQKNTSKIDRKSTENRMTKRMGFYKKWSEVCEVYRFR
mgnify:CR=1 FL=1